jgi:prolyl-tRNA synthetase
MSDFELIGFPYAVVIGKKLSEGLVELVDRKSGEKEDIRVEDIVEVLQGK